MKKILSLFMVAVLCLVLITPSTANAAIKINKKSITLEIGDTFDFKITGTKASIKWSSTDTGVATITSNGKATCVDIGVTIIKATVKNKVYSCELYVWPVDKNVTLYEDDYIKLTYFNVVDGFVYFKALNKTSEPFKISDEYLILDGTTYPASYTCWDVSPNYSKMFFYNSVSDIEDIEKITGSFYIYGDDGFTIETLDFKDIGID